MINREHGGGPESWTAAIYRIEVAGPIPQEFSDCFSEMKIIERVVMDQSVVTSMTGPVVDQAALTGMLDGLADLHLPILSVERLAEIDEGDVSGKQN